MKYKNKTIGVLKFRAHDKDGKKRLFELKPGKEIESDRRVNAKGLEIIEDKKNKKGDK